MNKMKNLIESLKRVAEIVIAIAGTLLALNILN